MILKKLTFNREQKKILILGIILLIFGFIIFQFISGRYSLAIAKPNQVCFPYKFWLIDKSYKNISQFSYNDYVAFNSRNIPYTKENTIFVKKIIGLDGDIVKTKLLKLGERIKKVYISDTVVIDKNIQAIVYVKNKAGGSYLLEAFATDSKNRPVPVLDSVVIPSGKIFVYSPHDRSYDSRYWGLVDESQIIGKAYPIF